MHHMTARRIASGILVAALLGILAGYLGAWVTYQNELVHGASYRSHEYTFLGFPALPGFIIAEGMSPVDWQLTEVWQHRHLIAAANGLCWFGVAGIIYLLRFIFLPRTPTPSIVVEH
jgi:hypothetical protein